MPAFTFVITKHPLKLIDPQARLLWPSVFKLSEAETLKPTSIAQTHTHGLKRTSSFNWKSMIGTDLRFWFDGLKNQVWRYLIKTNPLWTADSVQYAASVRFTLSGFCKMWSQFDAWTCEEIVKIQIYSYGLKLKIKQQYFMMGLDFTVPAWLVVFFI